MFLFSFTPAVMRLNNIPQYTAIIKSEEEQKKKTALKLKF